MREIEDLRQNPLAHTPKNRSDRTAEAHRKGGPSNPGGGSSGGTAAPSNTDGADPGTEKASEASQSSKAASGAKPVASNGGTLILDAACAPVDIRYPMDISLLNEAGEKAEAIIRSVCRDNNLPMPGMYCENARKEYRNLAKSKKPSAGRIRSVVKGELSYLRRDLRYIEDLMAKGKKLDDREMRKFVVIRELCLQQKYMYDNKVHRVDHRIVSLPIPFIRPIVRGKTNNPVEFGPRFDMRPDESGLARIEKFSYESYNETETCRGRSLPGTGPGRPDRSDEKEQGVLQRAWHTDVRTETWQKGI